MNILGTCTLQYATQSYKKMNLIASLERGKKTSKVLHMLQFTNKKGASILYKVVKSACANALHNGGYPQELVNDSFVRIEVGKGMNLKRIRFTSRARMSYYHKYRAHVRVSLLANV